MLGLLASWMRLRPPLTGGTGAGAMGPSYCLLHWLSVSLCLPVVWSSFVIHAVSPPSLSSLFFFFFLEINSTLLFWFFSIYKVAWRHLFTSPSYPRTFYFLYFSYLLVPQSVDLDIRSKRVGTVSQHRRGTLKNGVHALVPRQKILARTKLEAASLLGKNCHQQLYAVVDPECYTTIGTTVAGLLHGQLAIFLIEFEACFMGKNSHLVL